MSDPLEGFDERQKHIHSNARTPYPAISITDGTCRILSEAYDKMGTPDGVRCFTKGTKLAFVPSELGHPNAYKVYVENGVGEISCKWLKYTEQWDDTPSGRFKLVQDGEIWITDLADPIETAGDLDE